MKLSICTLFCDKDFQYIPSLIKNIEECVSLDYEIILIDNRIDKTQELKFNKAKVFPCDKLGQFNGRRLAIEKASGDYIWFVDADDSVMKIPSYVRDELSEEWDIFTFNAEDSFGEWTGTWPERSQKEKVINMPNLMNAEVGRFLGPCVWNKFFKRDVLLPSVNYDDAYITFNEDSLFNMIALKYAKTIKSSDITLYKYRDDRSQAACKLLDDYSKYKNLIGSGFNYWDMKDKIFNELERKETEKWISKDHFIQFFISRIYHSVPDIQVQEMKDLCELYDLNDVKRVINEMGVCDFAKETAPFSEIARDLMSVWKKTNNVQTKSLSICFNFCDKDFKYVPKLIHNIKKKVKLKDYEIVICDNRTDDNGKDQYIEGVYVWPTGGNLGPLGGRKEALKHITKDYVWFIDADDLIEENIGDDCQKILDKGYDYVAFKAVDDKKRVSGIWADTTGYDNKEINDEFFFSYRTYLMSGATLWNKWVKTDVFKCILDIPDTTAVCYEDALCNSYIMKHSKNMFLYNKQLYYYRSDLGDANRSNIKELASFQRTTNGGRTTLDLAKKLFTEKELFAMDTWFSDLRYLEFSLKRVIDSDASIQQQEIYDLMNYFKVEDIATAFKYFTWYFDKNKVDSVYKMFKRITRYKEEVKYKKCKLSIVVSFFDKDMKRIHELLWNIKNRMKTNNYEIILINNCLHNNKFIPYMNGIQVYASGSTPQLNKGTYHTRQLGVKYAYGEYVWFIDADDKIINDVTDEDLELLKDNKYDIVIFNSQKDDGTETKMGKVIGESYEYKQGDKLLSNNFYSLAGPCLWNKWIKKTKLFGILETDAYPVNAFEDTIVSSFAAKNSKSAYFYNKTLYEYFCSDSNTCSETIRKEDIDKIFLGKDCIDALKECLFSKDEMSKVFCLSSTYSDNFFNSRLKKAVYDDDEWCIISNSPIYHDKVIFKLSDNIASLNSFKFVFINICGADIKDINIKKFENTCFQGTQTLDMKNIFKYNFFVSTEDFKKMTKGEKIIIPAAKENNITV